MTQFHHLQCVARSLALTAALILSGSARAQATPGGAFLADCEFVDKAGITDQQNLSRVVCMGFILSSLSYYRAEWLYSGRSNEEAITKGKKDAASLRNTPSSFCYPINPSVPIHPISASAEAQGLVRFLRSLPASTLMSQGPGDDVRMRLFWAYMESEYPCDQYFMTFGPEAKKYRPKSGATKPR